MGDPKLTPYGAQTLVRLARDARVPLDEHSTVLELVWHALATVFYVTQEALDESDLLAREDRAVLDFCQAIMVASRPAVVASRRGMPAIRRAIKKAARRGE